MSFIANLFKKSEDTQSTNGFLSDNTPDTKLTEYKISLNKTVVNLEKSTGVSFDNLKSRVNLVLDYSGSMEDMYMDGTVQEVVTKILPLALKFDDNGELDCYLFSNSLAPGIIGASLEMFRILKESNALHDKLAKNVTYFRDKMMEAGFDIKPTQSAICAVMLYDARLSQEFAAAMQKEGIYVTGFYYPVVPKGQARIRVQLSAGHETEHLDKCIAAFIKVGKQLGVIK